MNLTIGRKITGGMLLLIALLITVGVIAWRSSSSASYGVHEVAEMMKDTAIGGGAMSEMLMVRMNVKDFLIDNLQKDIDEYDSWKSKFLDHIKLCEESFQNPDRKKWVVSIKTKFATYDAAFDQVKDVIKQRNEIINSKLNVVGPKIAADLKTLDYEAIEKQSPNTEVLSRTTFDLFEGRLYLMKFLIQSREADFERANQELSAAVKGIEQAISLETDPATQTRMNDVKAMIEEYVVAFAQVHDLMVKRNDLVKGTLDTIGPEIAALGTNILDSLAKSGDQVESDVMSQMQSAQVMVLGIVIVSTVLGLVIALLITRSVVHPIKRVVDMIKDIAQGEGDLTQRVDASSKDELGELGRWFNTFVGKVHDIIAQVSGVTREVAGAATQIAASSEEMAQGMQQQTQQTTHVSSAVEQMSSTVVEVARKSSDAAGTADSAGQQANEGGRVVQQTVEGMKSIAAVVNESASAINELGKRGEQIGQVIGVINDIADQTNLLALNAAIEAARAGEHGRGFAVVADEVRKLAERTTQATEEVAESIKAIQTETSSAVERMSTGTERVDEGVRLAEQAGDSLSAIVEGSDRVATMIQSIAAAAEEQSAASEEIARNVEQINAVTKQSAEGAGQAAQAATQLSGKAEQLQQLVGQFKLQRAVAEQGA